MEVVEKYGYNEFDVYCIEEKRLSTTKEITVMVDFEKGKISGNYIAYGESHYLDSEECKELLEAIPLNERLRDYESFLIEEGK